MNHSTNITLGAIIALASSVSAATLSWSSTAPTEDGADIANFVGATIGSENIEGGNFDNTFLAGDRNLVGQSFTTGANGGNGYALNSVTLQQVPYGETFWSLDAGWNGIGVFQLSIGTFDGSNFTPTILDDVAVDMVAAANPALSASGGQVGTGTGWFFTVDLATESITLDDNTQYAFLLDATGPYVETNGSSSATYAGGTAFGVNQAEDTLTTHTGDRVFHVDLTAVPEPSIALLGGLGVLGLLRRRRL